MTEAENPQRETPFSQIARSITLGLRCGDCHRLYEHLDQRQGSRSRALKGVAEVADRLGWQHRTAQKHLRHLADVGIVELDPPPAPGWGNTWVRLVHQPARGRHAELRIVPGVWEPDVERRWRSEPKSTEDLRKLAERPDAERVAPPVRTVLPDGTRSNAWRDAPPGRPNAPPQPEVARRATRKGASRHLGRSNAERDAPSVPNSPMYEVLSSAGRCRCGSVADRTRGGRAYCALCEPSDATTRACALIETAFGGFAEVDDGPKLPRCACGKVGDRHHDGTPYCEMCEPFLAAEAGG